MRGGEGTETDPAQDPHHHQRAAEATQQLMQGRTWRGTMPVARAVRDSCRRGRASAAGPRACEEEKRMSTASVAASLGGALRAYQASSALRSRSSCGRGAWGLGGWVI